MKIERAEDLDALRFSTAGGLVTIVVQDARDDRVLMVAWANREALKRTLATGHVHFYSRTRQRIWRKGETSGSFLTVAELRADSDANTVVALVHADAAASRAAAGGGAGLAAEAGDRVPAPSALDSLLAARAASAPEGSYTARLLADRNLRLKKLTEEAGELVVALADEDRDAVLAEGTDLLYHLLVACRATGLGLGDLLEELEARLAGNGLG